MTGVHKWSRHGLQNFAHNDGGVAFTCDGNRLEVCWYELPGAGQNAGRRLPMSVLLAIGIRPVGYIESFNELRAEANSGILYR